MIGRLKPLPPRIRDRCRDRLLILLQAVQASPFAWIHRSWESYGMSVGINNLWAGAKGRPAGLPHGRVAPVRAVAGVVGVWARGCG